MLPYFRSSGTRGWSSGLAPGFWSAQLLTPIDFALGYLPNSQDYPPWLFIL